MSTDPKAAWAKRVAKSDPMFLRVEAISWTTQTVWVQFRSRCPRCGLACTLSFTAAPELAYSHELREHIRWTWEELLMGHACLVKGAYR